MQFRIFLAVIFFLVAISACINSTDKKERAREFMEEPVYLDEEEIANVKVSPNGDHVSYVIGEDRRLKLLNLVSREMNTVKSQVLDHKWIKNSSEILLISRNKDNRIVLHRYSPGSEKLDSIYSWETQLAKIEDLRGYPSTVLHMINNNKSRLVKISPELEISEELSFKGKVESVIINDEGKMAAVVSNLSESACALLIEKPLEGLTETFECIECSKFELLFFDFFEKDQVVAISDCGRERASVVRMDPDNGEVSEVLFELPDADITELEVVPKKNELAYFRSTQDDQYEFLNPTFASIYKLIREKHSEGYLELLSWDSELRYFVFLTGDELLQSNYKLVDHKKEEIRSLDDSRLISSASQ